MAGNQMDGRALTARSCARAGLGLAAVIGILIAPIACGPASTDEQCDDACGHWSLCDDAGSGYTYTYDGCLKECKREGDWDQGYVDCVTSKYWCSDMEAC